MRVISPRQQGQGTAAEKIGESQLRCFESEGAEGGKGGNMDASESDMHAQADDDERGEEA